MKTISKLPPCDLYDIAAMENWLEDMSAGVNNRMQDKKTIDCLYALAAQLLTRRKNHTSERESK